MYLPNSRPAALLLQLSRPRRSSMRRRTGAAPAVIGGLSVMPFTRLGRAALLLSVPLLLSLAGPAWAAETTSGGTGGTAWVITASALVLFMTLPGLALFYGGLVRARNLLSVLMH